MKSLQLDFGPRRRSIAWYAGCVLLAVALLMVGGAAWRFMAYAQVGAALQAEHDRPQGPSDPMTAQVAAPSPLSKERTEQMAQAVGLLAAPWEALLADVEAAMDERVALLGLEPDLPQGTLRLRGEARDIEAVFAFVRRIDAAPALDDAYLDQYQLSLQDPQRPVQFTLVARWPIALAVPAETAGLPGEIAAAPRVAVEGAP